MRRVSRSTFARLMAFSLGALTPVPALAATGLDGAHMSLLWTLPFVGLLLNIATGPVFYPHVWEHHYGKFAMLWSALIIASMFATADAGDVVTSLARVAIHDYAPFILLLLALFTVAGGLYLDGNLPDSSYTNVALLAFGTLLASIVGTTGAAMILIRPLIRANDDRQHNAHVVVFFIFLVANIGGALSPLGDPPLFLGFLEGVDFFWPTRHLWPMTFATAGLVLAIFWLVDLYFYRRDRALLSKRDPTPNAPLHLYGKINLVLIALIIVAILITSHWTPGTILHIGGVALTLPDVVRNAALLVITLASLVLTKRAHREANGFAWAPIREVAILFAGIFICIIPVIAMLDAGRNGPFASLFTLVSHADGRDNPAAYFWLTGGLSSVLDNAPTYLVFFELAGGDPQILMTAKAAALAAISCGAVFMGANTYIGNAPNFMVYAIARNAGIRMPGFFAYMVWSVAVLIPVFVFVSWIFF